MFGTGSIPSKSEAPTFFQADDASNSPYSHVQFIGIHKDASRSFKRAYGGHPDDSINMSFEIQEFTKAVHRVANHITINHSDKVLKIVVAPEFYFRSFHGAYHIEDVHTIMEHLKQAFCGEEWNHWLFIPGTVAAHLTHGPGEEEMFNICFYFMGGNSHQEGIVYKEFFSTLDYVDIRRKEKIFYGSLFGREKKLFPTQGSRDVGGVPIQYPIYEEGNGNLAGGCILVIKGIRIGIEICFDHIRKRLKNYVVGDASSIAVEPVHLQIIPSFGGKIISDNLAVVYGGLVFNVDSLNAFKEIKRCQMYVVYSGDILNQELVDAWETFDFTVYPVRRLPFLEYTEDSRMERSESNDINLNSTGQLEERLVSYSCQDFIELIRDSYLISENNAKNRLRNMSTLEINGYVQGASQSSFDELYVLFDLLGNLASNEIVNIFLAAVPPSYQYELLEVAKPYFFYQKDAHYRADITPIFYRYFWMMKMSDHGKWVIQISSHQNDVEKKQELLGRLSAFLIRECERDNDLQDRLFFLHCSIRMFREKISPLVHDSHITYKDFLRLCMHHFSEHLREIEQLEESPFMGRLSIILCFIISDLRHKENELYKLENVLPLQLAASLNRFR